MKMTIITMKKNTKKVIIVECGVWADRLTYFAQNHHILETADFKTFPSFYRMTKAQYEEYIEFVKKLDNECIEQYLCKPQAICHIWFTGKNFSGAEIVLRRE